MASLPTSPRPSADSPPAISPPASPPASPRPGATWVPPEVAGIHSLLAECLNDYNINSQEWLAKNITPFLSLSRQGMAAVLVRLCRRTISGHISLAYQNEVINNSDSITVFPALPADPLLAAENEATLNALITFQHLGMGNYLSVMPVTTNSIYQAVWSGATPFQHYTWLVAIGDRMEGWLLHCWLTIEQLLATYPNNPLTLQPYQIDSAVLKYLVRLQELRGSR